MQLPINTFKAALRNECIQYGLWAGFASGYCAEISAGTGFDWLLIDGEHAPNDVRSLLAQLQAVASYDVAPVIRPVCGDTVLIKQLLDIGAQTLMVPMVETADQAHELVRAMRYPPEGIRGIGGGLTRATRWDGVAHYLDNAHKELCLIVQIESRKGVENAAEIAAVDGVDALFVGPFDLSAGLGHLGEPTHPEVEESIVFVIETALKAGKGIGILAPVEADARRYLAMGCHFVAVGIDISVYCNAARALAARFKGEADDETASGAGY